jgi:hypothetical protein
MEASMNIYNWCEGWHRLPIKYSMWQDGWDWLVIAHESVDGDVSVQFHPPSVRLPKPSVPDLTPMPERRVFKRERELEVA